MKDKKEIYLVVKHSGMLHNDKPVIVCAFTNLESATKYADDLNDDLAKLNARFLEAQDNACYQMRMLMDAYIEKNYPEYWEVINKEMTEDEILENDLVLERVSQIEYDLEGDRDELFEFAKERNVSEKDLADIQTYYEYMDNGKNDGTLPFYTILKGVELIED